LRNLLRFDFLEHQSGIRACASFLMRIAFENDVMRRNSEATAGLHPAPIPKSLDTKQQDAHDYHS
jgi:hypothetical protein